MDHYKNEPRNVSDLIPYVNNSRTHSDEQVAQVAASIKEFGFTNPILIDDAGMIIAGHGRVMAAKKLGVESVPCIVLSGLSEAQKKAYIIADNNLALNAGWDFDILRLEVEHLAEIDFNVDLLGFDADVMGKLWSEDVMPSVSEKDLSGEGNTYEVVVECNSEQEQELVYNMTTKKGYTCRISTY